MNFFMAMPLPLEVGRRLARCHDPTMPGARWVTPDRMHITLHFLGAAPTERVGALIESLSCAAIDPAPEICVRGVGAFGQRVLYAKVAPDAAVKEFAAGFEPLLRRFELPTSPRPYVPHVTIARLRGTSDTVVRTWRRRWSALESEPFRAEGYVFRSEPRPNGPPSYVRLGPRH